MTARIRSENISLEKLQAGDEEALALRPDDAIAFRMPRMPRFEARRTLVISPTILAEAN